jgi:hypothetical protein
MKQNFSISRVPMAGNRAKVSFLTVLMMCALGSGCNFKTAAEKAQDKADQQAQQQQNAPADALAAAKKELNAHIALYEAFAGEYDGGYLDANKDMVTTKVVVTVSNEPADAEIADMTSDTDVQSREQQMALQVQTQETEKTDPGYSFFCTGTNIKPDFSQGLLHFGCDGETTVAAPRDYYLNFAAAAVKASNDDSEATQKAQAAVSAKLGEELAAGQMTMLPAFRMTVIMNPQFGGEFVGTLLRQY